MSIADAVIEPFRTGPRSPAPMPRLQLVDPANPLNAWFVPQPGALVHACEVGLVEPAVFDLQPDPPLERSGLLTGRAGLTAAVVALLVAGIVSVAFLRMRRR